MVVSCVILVSQFAYNQHYAAIQPNILNPRNEYNTLKPSGHEPPARTATGDDQFQHLPHDRHRLLRLRGSGSAVGRLDERPTLHLCRRGSERRSAPSRAATAPAAKGFPVIQRCEYLWRPGALNGINAWSALPQSRKPQRRSFGNGGGGAIHVWSRFPNLQGFYGNGPQ